MTFDGLPRNHFKAIYADPPWRWESWGKYRGQRAGLAPKGDRSADKHYDTAETSDIAAMPVADLAADDCVLFMWATWPMIDHALDLIRAWGFEYKTCAFCWTKADGRQMQMFDESIKADMLLGYWTRANSEPCLLATRGKPKRLNADVRQAIIEPRREHSRKPDCVPGSSIVPALFTSRTGIALTNACLFSKQQDDEDRTANHEMNCVEVLPGSYLVKLRLYVGAYIGHPDTPMVGLSLCPKSCAVLIS